MVRVRHRCVADRSRLLVVAGLSLPRLGWVERHDSGICRVKAYLASGDTYTFSVEFRASVNGCCGSLAYPIDASAPVLVDGGTDPSP